MACHRSEKALPIVPLVVSNVHFQCQNQRWRVLETCKYSPSYSERELGCNKGTEGDRTGILGHIGDADRKVDLGMSRGE